MGDPLVDQLNRFLDFRKVTRSQLLEFVTVGDRFLYDPVGGEGVTEPTR